jgi:hypothetical protein
MSQVAHATAAVLHTTRGREETQLYLDDLENMRKVGQARIWSCR